MADPIRTVLVEQKLIYEERIAELRKERDEARREVCQFRATSYPHDMKEVYEIADSRGWDCYKETHNDI
jgi:TPP-dependent pyruvate/acetoin dehydrogenase alpha subunit